MTVQFPSRDFARHGCAIFRGLVPRAGIEALRVEVDAFCRDVHSGHSLWRYVVGLSVLREHRNPGIALTPETDVPFLINTLPVVFPSFRSFLLFESLWNLAREILGPAGEITYHFSNITRKPARIGPNISWHRDFPNGYICPEEACHFFRCLIPLEVMDAVNGATAVLPGTHIIPDVVAIAEEKRRDFDLSTAATLDTTPGDVIAIDSKIVHGGLENRSGRDRNLLVIQFGLRTDRYRIREPESLSGLTRAEILQSV